MKSSYFKYKDGIDNFDNETLLYWRNVLGEENFKKIEECYNVDINCILSGDKDEEFNSNYTKEQERIKSKIYNENYKNHEFDSTDLFNDEKIVFSNFFLPLINIGIEELIRQNSKYLNKSVIISFSKVLIERLGRVSIRTLILEMYILKSESKLVGQKEDEEYVFFNEHYLEDQDYILSLFDCYPCLLKLIIESIINLSDFFNTLLVRISKDYNVLKNTFFYGHDFFEILNINADLSDSHNNGKVVCIIHFDNGYKIVYKPHSLQVNKIYNEFLTFIMKGCKYPLYIQKTIDRENYGWEEFISYKSCIKNEEIKRYYYRFGILTCIHYILNTNDLHEENLISHGEYPIIIDLETILSIRNYNNLNNSAKEIINSKLRDSVLSSGLLPHYKFLNNDCAIDMSAINGSSRKNYPIKIPVIKNMFTSNMKIEYEHPISRRNKNRLNYKGEFINSYDYLEDIREGFSDTYKYIYKNKIKICNLALKFEDVNVRYIVQDTQRYSMLLFTSFHPDFMQEYKDRQLFLCNLFNDYGKVHNDFNITKSEINDLLNMDIPYFYANTSDTSIYSSSGKEIKNIFNETAVEHLLKKIKKLSEDDLTEQLMLMSIMLTDLDKLYTENKEEFKFSSRVKSNENEEIILEAIYKIAEEITEKAIFNSDRSEVNWLGLNVLENEKKHFWNLSPLGVYLYEGLGGICIFFEALYRYTSKDIYRNISRAIGKELFTYTDDMLKERDLTRENSGIFSGEASIVYTYEVLYSITKNIKYLKYAKKHLQVLDRVIKYDNRYDLIYGNAGALVAIVNLYELTNNEDYIKKAIDVSNNLIKIQKNGSWKSKNMEMPLAGLSHGTSGIIMALSKLFKFNNDFSIIRAIEKGISFEDSLFVKSTNNWRDDRMYNGKRISEDGKYPVAWCHGSAGILLSRIKINQYTYGIEKSLLNRDINRALVSVIDNGIMPSNCLCHGNLGNTEILLEYTKIIDDINLRKKCNDLRVKIANEFINVNFNSKNNNLFGYELLGFMTGLSGMGYSLLRDLDDGLPCILALEI